ncbi:MAG: 3'-5' exonuclease [Nitrospirae bacterium]|nr:3'-5' exonuclease [Nitrospirota bacterium]
MKSRTIKDGVQNQYSKAAGRFIAVDVETTGLSTRRGDRIIEIGAVVLEGDRIGEEFHALIRVNERIHWAAQQVHGITNEMLLGKPLAEEVMPEFRKFVTDSTLVAHNARFDMGFISHEFLRLGVGLTNPYNCTLELSRRLYPKLLNHRLETVYRHLFGRIPEQTMRHRALDDAQLVARVWVEMMKR